MKDFLISLLILFSVGFFYLLGKRRQENIHDINANSRIAEIMRKCDTGPMKRYFANIDVYCNVINKESRERFGSHMPNPTVIIFFENLFSICGENKLDDSLDAFIVKYEDILTVNYINRNDRSDFFVLVFLYEGKEILLQFYDSFPSSVKEGIIGNFKTKHIKPTRINKQQYLEILNKFESNKNLYV